MIRAAFLLAACAAQAVAQCSMCRTVAAAQNAAGVLDAAILVLFVPALALFSGTLIMAFRFRAQGRDPEDRE
jgi:hypothetical protein